MTDFFFPHTGPLALGGAVEKFGGNIAAIQALKLCLADNRPATSEEQHILAHYVGWGDSAVLKQSRDAHELNALLTDEERRGLQASSLNAHFTDIPVIAAIWDGLIHAGLGRHAFRAIDPSAGIGHFKSAMPDGLRPLADWVEVELDPLTAGILELLHPESKIFPQGYDEVELPQEWFDLAISNVPFGDYPVASTKTPKFLRHCIHDFFFANTVPALCPGGIMAFITSRYTMDKKDSEVRQWLARRLELLAAVRLPDNAFRKNAGTEVVTDILIFQKRTEETTEKPAWIESEDMAFQHNHRKTTEPINQYFIDHPEMVLGIPSLTGSMYRGDSYTVEPVPDQDLGVAIRQALISALPSGVIQPIQTVIEQVKAAPVVITTAEKAPNPEQQRRIDAMHSIYRAAKAVLASEIDGHSLAETSTLRETLNKIYDAFAGIYGPINFPTNTRLLQGSAELPFLKALEIYDTTQLTSKKAGIFQTPMVRAINRSEALSVTDGLLLSLDRKGYVDIAYIAAMTHSFEADVIQQLGERIFELPQGGWETSDAYLSGNIVQKLREAKAAAALDSKFVRNVLALNAVLPEPLKPGEIRAPLGAGWVPTDAVGQFFEHLLTTAGAPYRVTYIPGLANWTVEGYTSYRIPDGLEHGRWGTGRYGAIDLIVDGLNAHTPVVYDPDPNDPNGRIINQVETIAAQAKLAEIKEEFERWLWNDPERAQRLATIYNERFNAYRVREYDGSHLSFPGLNKAITLRPHQANMVWRTLQSETVAVGHKVGMGKTLVGIVSMMEAKRLGLTKKAMVVVPNHLTGQWYAQAVWAYPNANILCVTASDLTKQNRGRFLSSIATNDWDLVIVPFSSFKLLPCSGKTMTDYFQREIDQLEEYLWELKAEKSYSRAVKEIEKTIKRFKVKLANAADMAKDSQETVTWEQLGVEMLVVDEFHFFKNLFFGTRMTRIAGLSNTDSQRAFDMFVKSRWLIEKGGKFVGMSGTLVTNTIAELFTMQRYFQQDELQALGLSQFDAWANQFALAEPGLEMTPDGSGFRMNTRFRKFVNVPELMKLFLQVADLQQFGSTTGIERPDLYNGKPVNVVSDGGPDLKEFVNSLAERTEKIRTGLVDPRDDNMLLITGEGRKAALDLSLVRPTTPDASMPKIDALVDILASIYEASQVVKGTQLVFCDLATPKPKR